MSARDKFVEALRSRGMMRPGEEWVIDANLNAFAHELAEQIRAAVEDDDPDLRADGYGDNRNVLHAADLIDPEAQR